MGLKERIERLVVLVRQFVPRRPPRVIIGPPGGVSKLLPGATEEERLIFEAVRAMDRSILPE